MKTLIKTFLFIIVTVSILSVGGYIECHYHMTARVTESNRQKVFTDQAGDTWKTAELDNFKIGDKVELLFYTNCTDNNRYDDKIEKITLLR